MSGQGLLDIMFCRCRIAIEQRLGAHDDARGTETALKGRMIDKGLLERIQIPCLWVAQTLDSCNLPPVALNGECHT